MARNDTGNAGKAAADKASETLGDVRQAARQVGENLRDIGSQVRDTATQQYDQLRDQASDYYEQGRQRALEMEQSLEQYVQEKPIQALLIAAGVGVVLGWLWKRR
jgi:ElaB/YqjD/DUF883 family membrane-anchored ribosome-binding protein